MNLSIKTLTLAGVMGAATFTTATTAFAATDMNPTMTCAEWKALGAEDRMTVAMMAINELDSGAMTNGSIDEGSDSAGGTSPQFDSTATTTAAEASNGSMDKTSVTEGSKSAAGTSPQLDVTLNDTPEAAKSVGQMDDASMAKFVTVCDQYLDATVSEAAAGLDGTM